MGEAIWKAKALDFENKGISWHTDASSVVWTLIYNGKLANEIARLVAIVEKCYLSADNRT